MIWYPFRALELTGMSGPVSTLLTYLLAMLGGSFLLPGVLRSLPRAGWWAALLVLSAGWANFGYVLAILDGEVMRVFQSLGLRAAEVVRLTERGLPTIPTTIGHEKSTNPFLRADLHSVAAAVGLEGAPAAKVFAAIRARKDKFCASTRAPRGALTPSPAHRPPTAWTP